MSTTKQNKNELFKAKKKSAKFFRRHTHTQNERKKEEIGLGIKKCYYVNENENKKKTCEKQTLPINKF